MQQINFVFLIICVVCFCEAKAEITERLKEDVFNIYKHIAIEAREIKRDNVTLDKIKYFLFTKNSTIKSVNYTEVDPKNPKELDIGNCDSRIIFIIHGWTENRNRTWYSDLTNAFLHRYPESYVVQVDWSEPANDFYTISSWNTKDVGQFVGEFIVRVHKTYSIPLKNFLVVGHSLGGQVSGYVGKKVKELTGEKLPRIVALDPAGPFFKNRPENERLNKNDAEVVQVIHTDGDTFGFASPSGTIDFFPNGGNSQPGCIRIDLTDIKSVAEPMTCSHHRSWQYYIEAVLNPRAFLAMKCGGWVQFQTNLCDQKAIEVAMGDLETRESGDFYLETNKDTPFGLFKKGGVGIKDLLTAPSKIF